MFPGGKSNLWSYVCQASALSSHLTWCSVFFFTILDTFLQITLTILQIKFAFYHIRFIHTYTNIFLNFLQFISLGSKFCFFFPPSIMRWNCETWAFVVENRLKVGPKGPVSYRKSSAQCSHAIWWKYWRIVRPSNRMRTSISECLHFKIAEILIYNKTTK